MAQSFVFLHGWGLNHAIWTDTLELLPESVHAVALDLPGFGHSPWKPELADFDKTVEHVASQISTSFNHPVDIVGWSMGGLIAIRLAELYPDLIATLNCVASSPCFIARPDEDWPGIEAKVLAQFQTQLEKDFAATLKRFLAVQAMGSPTSREDTRRLQAHILAHPMPDPDALKAGLNWLANIDCRSALLTLDKPVKRLYGRLDSLVPSKLAYDFSLPGHAEVFSKSAHTPFLNQPKDFVKWLLT